ncbi:MAG: 50S ribosomal protein L5 [Chlamydiia bacterium]|nr:50S ribosomal protein L5 [Chlamydiia bacterium]
MSKEDVLKIIENDTEKSYNQYWLEDIVPVLKKDLKRENIYSLPKLDALVLHIRVNSKYAKDKAYLQSVDKDLTLLAGQKCQFVKAKKSVANFKIREGQVSGAKVTLRRNKMKSFMYSLRDVVIPALRDFRGLPKKFDTNGGYNLTIFNHDIFPGVDVNEVKNIFKVHVSFVMRNVKSSEEGFSLLSAHKMPFVKKKRGN